MLHIIIMESQTIEEFARRAEAWSASDARPFDDHSIALALIAKRPVFVKMHKATVASLKRAIATARTARLSNRSKLFNTLIKDAR